MERRTHVRRSIHFLVEFGGVCLLVEGRGSRVTSRGSRVEGRKMIQNYFQIISELRQLKSSQARVYSSFWCLFLPHLGHIFVCQKRLYFHGLSGVLSIRISIALTVKLFFSGPGIRIIAEDNANAEELELNFGTKKPVHKCQRKKKEPAG